MSSTEVPARRILVALDSSSYGLAALEAAAKLAVEARAELEGLFVEDINLLRLAGLPFAQEVTYPSAAPRPLDVTSVENALRDRADEVRRALAEACHRVSVRWSFRVTRGPVTRTTLEAGAAADLLIMGRQSSTIAASRRWRLRRAGTILVVFDGSEASQRALEVATRLGRNESRNVVVVLAANDRQQVDELRRNCQQWCESHDATAVLDRHVIADAAPLGGLTQQWDAELLLINWDSGLLNESTIESLVSRLDCPIGLVR